MADIVFMAIGLAFFGVCALYVRGCERIVGPVDDSRSGRAVEAEGIPVTTGGD